MINITQDKIDNESIETCHMFINDNLNETEGTGDVWIECDVCGWQMPFEPRMPDFNYCPNCGAYMKTINKVKPIRKCCKTCKYLTEAYTFYGDGIYMKKLVCLGEKE